MKQRIESLDFLKCIFIILMVAFHLVYIGDKYPYLKQMVYTFHMPGFLILSGYVVNIHKTSGKFLKSQFWIFLPYLVFETAYVLMAAALPIKEHLDTLNPAVLANKVFLHPIGPYWYLHTLILSNLIVYISAHAGYRLGKGQLSALPVVTALSLFAWLTDLVSLPNALYYSLGFLLADRKVSFISFFKPTLWAAVPLGILFCFSGNLNKFTLGGMAIVYLVITLLLALYTYLPATVKSYSLFIGRNTLPVLLLSPGFTIILKGLVPFLSFDPTGLLFLLLALSVTFSGCFLITFLMDRLKISPYFWGRDKMLS